MVHESHRRALRPAFVLLSVMALGLVLAWAWPVGQGPHKLESYLPAHTMLEMFAVVVALLVFSSGWNAYSRSLPHHAVILSCAFLGVALLDFTHAMSYAGMPALVTHSSPQKAINFWLAARFLAAMAFLTVAVLPARPMMFAAARYGWLLSVLGLVAMVHWVFLYHPDVVPETFSPTTGLTSFKVGAEFTIIGIYAVAAAMLLRSMRQAQPFNVAALFAAVCAMALSECFFTFYIRVNDVFNLMGHLYKVVSYLFLYRAVFVEVIEEPYRELAEVRDQLRATLDAVPDVLLEMDLEGRYHAVHSLHPDWLVAPAATLLGKTVQEVMPADGAQVVMNALKDACGSGLSVGTQLELQLPQGPRWFELSVSRKGEPDGVRTRFIVLSRDVTERKLAEAAMRAQEAADQASRAKSEFLSRMSHELRTPLNAVIGFAQLLLHSSTSRLSSSQKLHVEHILSGGEHLLEMINDILDLTRIESGHAELTIEPVIVGVLLADSLPMVLPQAEARGVTVHAEAALSDQRQVRGDVRRLKQVLINVLSNAVKYNHHGGRVMVRCECRASGGELALIIADTGRGLSPEQLQRLFEPFNRLGADRSGIEGTGLGLVITRRLIESMGGSITLESTVGVGTEVILCLPLVDPAEQAPARHTADASSVALPPMKGRQGVTVLCIEDNPLNSALLRAIFDLRPDLTLVIAEDGQQGLELLKACRPDLLLIDINLPDMSGVDVLHTLRKMPEGQGLRCIAMSADVSGDPLSRAREQGFADFWPKPLDVDQMLLRLDAALSAMAIKSAETA